MDAPPGPAVMTCAGRDLTPEQHETVHDLDTALAVLEYRVRAREQERNFAMAAGAIGWIGFIVLLVIERFGQ